MLFGQKKSLDEFEVEALPHMGDLHRAASRLLEERPQADDVIQEVYLKAWKSFHRFERGTNCRAWLFRIMFNCVHDHRRRWGGSKTISEERDVLESRVVWTPPIPDSLADEEILGALDGLPVNYREVILLADVEEFAYKEIAQMLGIPMGTVMSRLSRARKRLRSALAGVAESYGMGAAEGGRA